MTNASYRERLIGRIRAAIQEVRHASSLQHPGLTGTVREIAVRNLFEPLLPNNIGVGHGKVIDSDGRQSQETDVIIYAKDSLAPIMYAEGLGQFPIESVLYVIEIKSTITAAEIDDVERKVRSLCRLRTLNSRFLDLESESENKRPKRIERGTFRPVFCCLAFESDLTGTRDSEIERYTKRVRSNYVKKQTTDLAALCVIGKGYWFGNLGNDNRWRWAKATNQYDELILFLAGIMNTLPELKNTRGFYQLGSYFSEEGLIEDVAD